MHSHTALYCIENANQLIVGYVTNWENAKTCPDLHPSKANDVSSGHFEVLQVYLVGFWYQVGK